MPVIFLISLLTTPTPAQQGAAGGQWRHYAGDAGSTKYSPLAQIDASNIDLLEVAWRWSSPDNEVAGVSNAQFESTPLAIDGVLYTSTSFSQVAAVDGATGETIWEFDPLSYLSGRPPNLGFLHRGVGYWTDGSRKRIFMATGDARLISLDAMTGVPDPAFGDNGTVNLKVGIPRIADLGFLNQYGMTSPPTICRDVVIVGSSIHDGVFSKSAPPGDVRGFDARTGELKWTFHTVPRAGEFGVETWQDDSWQFSGHTNAWAPLSADEELGFVYLPVGCPTNNYYGGPRPGDNLFSSSLVCLNAETGERVWHYQLVHHDIWDYDLPAAPNLVDITVDGVAIKAVAQVTKHGFTFVFDRVTGEPVWPIEERAVPQSTVPGEQTSPTQPFPTKPPPFERQGVTIDELINFSAAQRQAATELINQFDWGPLFTPPTERGVIQLPGIGGGANWGGAAFDPQTSTLYVASLGTLPYLVSVSPAASDLGYNGSPSIMQGPDGFFFLFKPPWNTITAIDLNQGKIAWQVPNDGDLGTVGISSAMVTPTLLFYSIRSGSRLFAHDKSTGERIWEFELGATPSGAPMTYRLAGKQYIVVAVGSGAQTMELVALALPGTLDVAPQLWPR